MRTMTRIVVGLAATAIATTSHAQTSGPFNYGEALQKSIYFYEAQQAGVLPSWNRVPWRGDAVVNDGSDVGLDLSGGWFDAGDHVKFGFPMAATATMLAWGAVDYRSAYQQAGQLDDLMRNLRFVNDYFIAAHPSPNVFYGQVGLGGPDHAFWGPPESVEERMGDMRPAAKIDLTCKGPDLAAETAAAMAASSMVMRPTDPAYADTLLQHARELYALALATVGTDGVENNYSNCITDATSFYNAGFGLYWDEMAWGAIWMWRATGEAFYRDRIDEFYVKMGFEERTTTPVFTWSQGWNDKAYGVYVLAARLIGDAVYHTDARRYLDHWIRPASQGGGQKTDAGLVVVDRFAGWGTMRYAANMAFLSLYYADGLGATDPDFGTYHDFGVRQINYILGDNPRNSSYVVGFGNNPPVNVHHRGAHGSWSNSIQNPTQQRHILYGAVVGGPDSTDDFNYEDDRGDFRRNEVAVDYNSGFTGAVARLYQEFGGDPIPDAQFPPPEGPFEEYLVGAKVNASGARFVEIKAVIQNKSTAPAQVRDDLSFRYFVDISEVVQAGVSANDITITTAFNQASSVSNLLPWGDPSDNIYYVEVSFAGERIYPGGQSEFRREVQFRMTLPLSAGVDWNNSNDPSWDPAFATTSEQFGVVAVRVPVYGANGRLFGEEPESCGGGTGINCLPIAQGGIVSTSQGEAVVIQLNGTDADGSITGRTITAGPANGTLSGSGSTRTYTPNAGFVGTDQIAFTVTDNDGATSAPATVSIEVTAAPVPSVAITAPSSGSSILVASPFTVTYSASNVASVNVLIDDTFVANTSGGSVALTAPSEPGPFTVTLVGIDASGASLGASDAVTLTAAQTPPPPSASCAFVIDNEWNDGFVAKIVITNGGTEPINGWQVGWAFTDGSSVNNLWNADLSGTNPYSANNLTWNAAIAPGESIEFGFSGSKGVPNTPAPIVPVTGTPCGAN